MTDTAPDPLAEIFTLIAAPLAGGLRSIEQFRKGVDEFLNGVENFNRTMVNLNQTAERINGMLEEVEEPLRVAIPQVTRTVQTADQMMQVVSGPAIAAAPGLERLAKIMSSPELERLPAQLIQFTDVLGDLSSRLAPLSQLAGSAGGLFGGLRIPGFSAPGDAQGRAAPTGHGAEEKTPEPSEPESAEPEASEPETPTVEKKSTSKKKPAGKKPAGKKPASKSKP